jgi:hypothetical protein
MLVDEDTFIVEKGEQSYGYDSYLFEVRSNQKVHVVDELSNKREGFGDYSVLVLEIPELRKLVDIASNLVFSSTINKNVLHLRFFVNDIFFTFKVKISTINEDIMHQYLNVVRGYKPLVFVLLDKPTVGYTDVVEQMVTESRESRMFKVEKSSKPLGYTNSDGELINAARQ